MKMKNIILAAVAVVLVAAVSVGGTFAFLSSKTSKITNTFTIGKVGLTLTETEGTEDTLDPTVRNFDLNPGTDVSKDPLVTVTANSLDSYVFVELDEDIAFSETTTLTFADFITYTMATGWTQLGTSNVWYRTYTKTATDVSYGVFADDKVTVADFSQDSADILTSISLTVYSGAIQDNGFTDAAEAWTALAGTDSTLTA